MDVPVTTPHEHLLQQIAEYKQIRQFVSNCPDLPGRLRASLFLAIRRKTLSPRQVKNILEAWR